jgi:hypothetical protein
MLCHRFIFFEEKIDHPIQSWPSKLYQMKLKIKIYQTIQEKNSCKWKRFKSLIHTNLVIYESSMVLMVILSPALINGGA